MVEREILDYYRRNDERDRLASGGRRIEFLRMWDLLERFLPSPPATVLDVGGGAGSMIPLAAAGYDVHLIDPVPLLVSQAAAGIVRSGSGKRRRDRHPGPPLHRHGCGDRRSSAELAQARVRNDRGLEGKGRHGLPVTRGDLATRITQAQARYAAAGQALQRCAPPMGDAQQQAYAAVWQAKAAQEQMTANAPAPPSPPGSPPPTLAEKTAASRRAANYEDATTALAQARRQFDAAVKEYQSAATKAANAIYAEINHDGLKDSWWERNSGWISTVFKIVAIVIMVLAIVSLILICPLTGPAIAALLGMSAAAVSTTLTVITIVSVTAMILQTVFDGIAMGTGMESGRRSR
jgi:hypothetical protein